MHSERNGALVGHGELNKAKQNTVLLDLILLRTLILEFRKWELLFWISCHSNFFGEDDGQLGTEDRKGSAKPWGSHRSILLKWQFIGTNMTNLTIICIGSWSIPTSLFTQKAHYNSTQGSTKFQSAAEKEIVSWCTGVGHVGWINNFFHFLDLTLNSSAENTHFYTLK